MSKSTGNFLTLCQAIDKFSADALEGIAEPVRPHSPKVKGHAAPDSSSHGAAQRPLQGPHDSQVPVGPSGSQSRSRLETRGREQVKVSAPRGEEEEALKREEEALKREEEALKREEEALSVTSLYIEGSSW
ncbi:hypothetical protein EYF80_049531 [Liparis tanakae]|uniref:Uncharacterized protein n=1 Tax=Liparis tanakae TaxID=230148 RepID=A0A4Z2FJ58_9TELE|nr:hypothetical protein EYF80_049531 [Liparis tanakae]